MIQPGIKYAVNLEKNINGKEVIINQKVYDEELFLGANETISKKIVYNPPASCNGNYKIYIVLGNKNGLTFADSPAGSVALFGGENYIYINPDSCYLSEEGKGSEKNNLENIPSFDPGKNITLHCAVEKMSYSKNLVTPSISSYYLTSLGDKSGYKAYPTIDLEDGNRVEEDFILPESDKPQKYESVLAFYDQENNMVSNEIFFSYVVSGASATIQNVRIDKDSYRKGEEANISFFYNRNNPVKTSGASPKFLPMNIEIGLKDGAGNDCSELFKYQTKETDTGVLDFSLPVTKECGNVAVNSIIKDSNGNVLANSDFSLKKQAEKNENTAGNPVKGNKFNWELIGLFFSGLMLLVILVALVLRFKKGNKLLIFLIAITGSFLFSSLAKADYIYPIYGYCYYSKGAMPGHFITNCLPSGDTGAYLDVSLNKASYAPGETIYVTANNVFNGCSLGYRTCTPELYYDLQGTLGSQTEDITAAMNPVAFTAPSSSGNLVFTDTIGGYYDAADIGIIGTWWANPNPTFSIPININPLTPPTAPTITGPTSGTSSVSYSFSATATAAPAQIRYGFDWDNDGTVDQWVPSSGYVDSGTTQTASYQWSSQGLETFKVLAQTSGGINSNWTSYNITMSCISTGCSANGNGCGTDNCGNSCPIVSPIDGGCYSGAINKIWNQKPDLTNDTLCALASETPADLNLYGNEWCWDCPGYCGGATANCCGKRDMNWKEVAP